MREKLKDLIEQVRKDGDYPEGLLESLEELQKTLAADASDREIEEAIQRCVSENLKGGTKEREESNLTEEDLTYMRQGIDTVKELFEEEEWRYAESEPREDVHIFEVGFTNEGVSLRMRISIESQPRVCRIDAILPIIVDKTYEYIVCKKIADANYVKRYGAFQYDERDGELSYRYSYPITYGVKKDELRNLILTVALSASEKYDEFKRACVGKFKAKELNEILENLNKLIRDLDDDE